MLNGKSVAAVELMAMKSTWRGVVVRWELTWGERRSLLPAGGDERVDPPRDTEHRIRLLVEIDHRLRFDDDAELCEWLRRPSELLHWYTPLEVMAGTLADLRRLRTFVEQGFGA